MIKEVIMLVTVININIPPKVDMDMTTYEKLDNVSIALNWAHHYESEWAINYWTNVRKELIKKYAN